MVAVVVIVVNEISVSLYNHLSSQSLHLFYYDYTLVSSGSCNCPFSWIYIQLVSRSSREQTPHCISKEGECKKMNKCTKKKRKVRKPEKLWLKAACISRAKSTEKWSFLYHLFVVVVVVVVVGVYVHKFNVRLIIKVNVIKLE